MSHLFTSDEVISILIKSITTEEQALKFTRILQHILGNDFLEVESTPSSLLLGNSNPMARHPFFSKIMHFNDLKLNLSKIDFLGIWVNVRAAFEHIKNPTLEAFLENIDEIFYCYREDLGLEVTYPLDYYSAKTSELGDPKPGSANLIQKISAHFKSTDPIEGLKFDYVHPQTRNHVKNFKNGVAFLINSIEACLKVNKNIETLRVKFEKLAYEDRPSIQGLFNRLLDQFESYRSLRAIEYRSVLKFYLDFFAEHPSETDHYIFKKISETLPCRNPFIALSTLAQTVYFADEEVDAQVELILRKINFVDAEGKRLVLDSIQEFMENFEGTSPCETEGVSFRIYKTLERYMGETAEAEGTISTPALSESGLSSTNYLTRTDDSRPESETILHPLLKTALDTKRPSHQWALATRALLFGEGSDPEVGVDRVL